MRILVVAPNWIGDAVMSLSLLQALHEDRALQNSQGKPCEIHVLAPPVTAPIYHLSPTVHSVVVAPFVHGKLQFRLRWKLARQLRSQGFDRAIVLPNSFKSALIPWLAGVAHRTGYSGELRGLVLNHVLPKPDRQNKPPMVQWYGRLGNCAPTQLANPRMHVPAQVRDDTCLAFDLTPGFLAVAPGAEYGPAKQWPASHVAQVVTVFLSAHPSQQAVVLGGPKDLAFSNAIVDGVPEHLRRRVRVLAGQTTLLQAMALLASAQALLSNDSGLMHVGAALDVQVHAVFGSSSPLHTPPLNPTAKVHWLHLDCSPCYARVCPLGHTHCLVQLQPEMVALGLVSDAHAV